MSEQSEVERLREQLKQAQEKWDAIRRERDGLGLDNTRLSAEVARLREALHNLVEAEWMVTCDWTDQDSRARVMDPARAALADPGKDK